MKPEYEKRYRGRVERLQRMLDLNAPPAIVAFGALLVAEIAVAEPPTFRGLIHYLIAWERQQLEMADEDSEAGKEVAAIIKAMDDLEFETAAARAEQKV